MSARRTLYALAGAALGLGAPAGLLGIRLMRRGLAGRSVVEEIWNDRETYAYTAASTSVAFALVGAASGLGATVSIGIASLAPSSGERPTPGALMAAADKALYRAKRAGGDRVAVRQDGGFGSSSAWARRYA